MHTAPMAHEDGYQNHGVTSPGALNLNHTDFPWKHRRFQSDPMNPPYKVLQLYDNKGRLTEATFDSPLNLPFRSDKDLKRPKSPLESKANIDLQSEIDPANGTNFGESNTAPFEPRVQSSVVPLELDRSGRQPPATLEQNFAIARDSYSHHGSSMGSPKVEFRPSVTGRGFGLGLGFGLVPLDAVQPPNALGMQQGEDRAKIGYPSIASGKELRSFGWGRGV